MIVVSPMAKERLFFTGSTRIIGDTSLSATDLRVYASVSLHDGMSLLKGKGAGCYASNQVLAAIVGCDYSTLCKALSKLVKAGYLLKQASSDDRRMTVYRVTFPTADEWRVHHPSGEQLSGDGRQLSGEAANSISEIGGEVSSETRRNLPETAEHYIPLKGELDSVETEEIDSVETARLKSRLLANDEREPNVGAELAKFERAFRSDPSSVNLEAWHPYLWDVFENAESKIQSHRAQRLLEDVNWWFEETGRRRPEAWQ